MPEQAVWRVTWAIPAPTSATLRAAVRMVGPPLLLVSSRPRWRHNVRRGSGEANVYFNLTNIQLAALTPTLSVAPPF
jgi:hypothetical protein